MENQQNNYTPIVINQSKKPSLLKKQPQIMFTGIMLAGLILLIGIFYSFINQRTSTNTQAQMNDLCSNQGGSLLPGSCPGGSEQIAIAVDGEDISKSGMVCCKPKVDMPPTVIVVDTVVPATEIPPTKFEPTAIVVDQEPTSTPIAIISVSPALVCKVPDNFSVVIECAPNQPRCKIDNLIQQ